MIRKTKRLKMNKEKSEFHIVRVIINSLYLKL